MKRSILVAAASLAVSGLCFAADPPARTDVVVPGVTAAGAGATGAESGATGTVRTDTRTTEVRTNTDANNNTNNNRNAAAPDADDIRKTVAKITENALNKGNFDDVCDYLVDADRDRVKQFKPADNYSKLDGRIDQFLKDWKSKYNEDFGYSSHRNDVLNDGFAQITQGEIGEARVAGAKDMPSAEPQNVKGGTPQDLKKSGVATPDANSNKYGGGNTNREPGRNVATFAIKPAAGMSVKVQPGANKPIDADMKANKELALPLIHELPDSWKVDLPDNIDGQKLYDNLLKHITMVDEQRDSWPADKNEAYREVTRHVMMALTERGT